jgi:hypothetical protein
VAVAADILINGYMRVTLDLMALVTVIALIHVIDGKIPF